jgi:hypothetical protein
MAMHKVKPFAIRRGAFSTKRVAKESAGKEALWELT